MTKRFLFLRSFLKNPGVIGAVAPSGPSLADLITSEIGPSTGTVLELGPGTGIFTEASLRRGVAEQDLILVEYIADFARMLQMRYPEARVLCMDAEQLGTALPPEKRLGAAISGLPLLNMRGSKIETMLRSIFAHMREDGALYQFTYGMACPIPRHILKHLDLKASVHGRILRNIPPARVYKITRSNHRPLRGYAR